ncbi:HEPN-associated N-terminal domain-containing protein [Novosphingobium sp. LASN5T]|uniref:HEPN-associated N-terminal domain-containing protein n=1 Tax=Novosphingobium sp. LASN5T TaxID=2491021 RepID=UPI000F5DE0E3|nr:HEPN-associated N-terminal domain-containing protein [Novosphingobium sp. LASN5T]RQW46132.1 RES domain-containing protein [Novosphingobium sp. LASN5T]
MGRAKEWMLEQYERGYSEADGDICADCVNDSALAEWIGNNLSATRCRFCGEESDEPIAASFDDFVGVVLGGISFDWNHPDTEGIMYISAEGGYQAPISDSWEVFENYDISDDDAVIEALIDSIDTDGWVEREFYRGDDSQRLVWGWDWFKHVTKHLTRYLFLKPNGDDRDDLPPSEMLDVIGSVIAKELRETGLVKAIDLDVALVRIRIGVEPYGDAGALGAPPERFATQSNRMSPAGIPMFYGAFDVATAMAETFDPAVHTGQLMSIGTFRAIRELKVLDLADLPDIPSVFDAKARKLIHPLRFLHAFARDLVQQIARDGREHIEYVPTQIVTEYFRRVFRNSNGEPVDGLIYRSSRNADGHAFVLFCENDQCIDVGHAGPAHDKLLQLHSVVHQPCPEPPGT